MWNTSIPRVLSIPIEIEIEKGAKRARDEKFAVVNFFPFLKVNGTIKRITSVEIEIISKGAVPLLAQKDFAAQSALKEGFWYRMSIVENGIYKIDRAYLEACGINVTGLNPASIHIYGNGEGVLPEENSIDRSDDLVQCALKKVGLDDGSFDNGDYLLFYGRGPHQFKLNGLVYNQETNIYSDVSNYFISVNSNVVPNYIESANQSNSPASQTVTTVDYMSYYGKEVFNLMKGGNVGIRPFRR